MIRIICPSCKNGYLETKDGELICPECQESFTKSDENLFLGIQYYDECNYDKANDYLMKYIVKNGAEPRAIFYKALCDGYGFDEDTLTLSGTYGKISEALQGLQEADFPHYLALANDETEKLEKAVAQAHIRLFADADAEKIKKEVSAIINLQNDAKAFRVTLNALTNDFNDKASVKLSVKFSDCFLVEPELAAEIGELKYNKIVENIDSHTVFTGILSTDIKNLEIYYRCIVMFFKRNRQKYEFLMATAEKFSELSKLLEDGRYNSIKGTAAIGDKLKSAGYDFFQESLKDTDEDYASQSETVIVIEAEPELIEEPPVIVDISSTTESDEESYAEIDDATPENPEDNSSQNEQATKIVDLSDISDAEVSEKDEADITTQDTPSEDTTAEETILPTDTKDSTADIEEDILPEEVKTEEDTELNTQEEAANSDIADSDDINNAADEVVDIEDIEKIATEAQNTNESVDNSASEVIEKTESTEKNDNNSQSTVNEIKENAQIVPLDADVEALIDAPVVKKKTKHKTLYKPFVAGFLVIVGIIAVVCCTIVPDKLNEKNYAEAKSLLESGKYKQAVAIYAELEDYEDSEELYKEASYNYALKLEKNGEYAQAKAIFEELKEYEDSMAKVSSCSYNMALQALDNENFDEAQALFEAIPDYADSKEKVKECAYQKACKKINEKRFEQAIEILESIEDYKPSAEKINEAKYKYVENNLSKDNETTMKFLKDLIEARYKDSVLLRKKLLGDASVTEKTDTVESTNASENKPTTNKKASSVINYDTSDIKKNLKQADKSKPIYFHATINDKNLYGKTLTAKFTTSVGYTETRNFTLSEEDNTYHLLYPQTTITDYTVEFSILDSDGTVILNQTITIV